MSAPALDAIVIGAGPNGLAAAITLARAGRSVRVYEANAEVGGGIRTAELTLPGFRHDPCATIVPLAMASPFFRTVDLASRGVEFLQPDAPFAHPLDGGLAAVLERSLEETAAGLGGDDGAAWSRLFRPFVSHADDLGEEILRPIVHLPRHPILLARFGLPALRSAEGLARSTFRGAAARALFAGVAAHAMLRLDRPLSASFGLVLATFAHAAGWPMVRGGVSAIADGLAAELTSLGGEIVTDHRVASLSSLPAARAVLLDVTPRQLLAIGRDRLGTVARLRAERFRYGAGVFKVDWALDGPVPWAADGPRRAATVHLGGTIDEIAASEAAVAAGRRQQFTFTLGQVPTWGRFLLVGHQGVGDLGCQHAVALVGHLDDGDQFLRRGVLQQVAAGAGVHGTAHLGRLKLVRMTNLVLGDCALSAEMAATPSIRGITRSIRTTSGSSAGTARTASVPSGASPTHRMPGSAFSIAARPWRIMG